jgi:hypothetical protein
MPGYDYPNGRVGAGSRRRPLDAYGGTRSRRPTSRSAAVSAVGSIDSGSVGPGSLTANYNATASQIIGLGRPSGGATVKTINLIPTNTLYGDRASQFDIRFSKIFRSARTRTSVIFDLANAVNASTILAVNTAYGA